MVKRILLTGSSGFIGKNILLQASKRNFDFVCVVRKRENFEKFVTDYSLSNISNVLELDLLKADSAEKLSAFINPGVSIIHTAWEATPGKYLNSSKNYDWSLASMRLAEKALVNKAKSFVGIGTCAEYALKTEPINVYDKLEPTNLYALSKALTANNLEKLFNSSSTRFVWARLFYLYGQFEVEGRLFADVKKAVSSKLPIDLTSGKQIKDYINVKTAANQIIRLASDDFFVGPSNVCTGKGVSIKGFLADNFDPSDFERYLRFGARKENDFDPQVVIGVPTVVD